MHLNSPKKAALRVHFTCKFMIISLDDDKNSLSSYTTAL